MDAVLSDRHNHLAVARHYAGKREGNGATVSIPCKTRDMMFEYLQQRRQP